MGKNRTTWTLVLAGLFIAGGGLLRPPDGKTGMPPAQFWAMKVTWPAAYDVVLAGDSRTMADLSPEAMQSALPGLRIANFGFPRCGLDYTYLRAVDALLDPASPHPIILIGVTPLSLTAKATSKNRFYEYHSKGALELRQYLWLGKAFAYLQGFKWAHLLHSLGEKRRILFQQYHSDGWMALREKPDNPRAALSDYKGTFQNNPVLDTLQDRLLRRVAAWTRRGVVVYGYRPPVPSWTLQMENEHSGFHEKAFVSRFTRAGGHWLPTSFQGYHSTDGSHLDPASAIAFSKTLAARLTSDPPAGAVTNSSISQ